MSTNTRTRNAQGQFVKASPVVTTTVKAPVKKATVKKVDPSKAERAAAKAEALAVRAAGLSLAEARANVQKARRGLAVAERTGVDVIKSRVRLSTHQQVLALVEAKTTTAVTVPAKRRRSTKTPRHSARQSLYV